MSSKRSASPHGRSLRVETGLSICRVESAREIERRRDTARKPARTHERLLYGSSKPPGSQGLTTQTQFLPPIPTLRCTSLHQRRQRPSTQRANLRRFRPTPASPGPPFVLPVLGSTRHPRCANLLIAVALASGDNRSRSRYICGWSRNRIAREQPNEACGFR
jgi:hypothetical protein